MRALSPPLKWRRDLTWKIEYDERVFDDYKRIGREAEKRIRKYLDERIATDQDPRRYGEPLKANLTGLWRYVVGNYRIIAEINEEKVSVLVIRVGHRKNIYGGH